MPRHVRIEFSGAMYHVMARGNRRAAIVQDDQDRVTFLRTRGATGTGAFAGGAGKFSDNAIRTVRCEKERLAEMPPCRTDPGGNHDETGLDQRGVGDGTMGLVLPADLPNTHQSREGSEAA